MNTQKPILAIVVQRSDFIDFYKNEVRKAWPHHSIYILANHRNLLTFDYPEERHLSLFPYITEPSWKNCKEDIGYVWHLENEEIVKTDYSNSDILNAAEKIIFVNAYICISDAITFQILLKLNLGKSIDKPCLFCCPQDPGRDEMFRSLQNPKTTDDEFFQDRLKWDTAKCYFDYNFNFNSCVLFKPALQKAGVIDNGFVFTKYILPLFYVLRDKSDFSLYEIVDMVYNWKGSGSYPKTSSPFSGTMIENLSKAELIKENGNGSEDDQHYDLTEKGKKIFELIHPDCWDIDIPGKLLLWQENWPESKKEMDEYLITFFKKQMEFVPSK